ncbi:hypothetical protein HZB60_07715 [candidate division KSB1 bacterium]|nr:hypothetical protein [candidate division KSB1 bacterium]
MTKSRILILLMTALALATGCSDDEATTTIPPAVPSDDQLLAGPESGKQFVRWNSVGLERVHASGATVEGWCYPAQETNLEILLMAGYSVPVGATPGDSLHCSLTVADTTYSQTDFLPEGITWNDSVIYWCDTSCVHIPPGSSAADICFYWYNPASGEFKQITTAVVETHWVAKTLHFSRYILGQKRSAN